MLLKNAIPYKFQFIVVACVVFLETCAQFAHAEKAPSLIFRPTSTLYTQNNAFLGTGTDSYVLTIPAQPTEILPTSSGPIQTGIVYALPTPIKSDQLSWRKISSGYLANVHIIFDQAQRLRLHIALLQTISMELRVQGNQDNAPIGPMNQSNFHDNELWLPLTNGDTVDLEIFLPITTPPTNNIFELNAVNYIIADSINLNNSAIPESLGLTKHKEFDLSCYASNPNYTALTQAAAATAKVNFIKDNQSYICSGTLLNDKVSSQQPWFITANHCLTTQAIANSASFEWFYQSLTCGGKKTDPRYQQTYGGATLLWTNFYLEPSFLKLNHQPAPGVVYSGWDTTINVADTVWGVHHPQGDQTMVSSGSVVSLLNTVDDSSQGGNHLLDNIVYTHGGVEPGSSGSGLFSVNNGQLSWKGTLFGVENDYQTAVYSHFANYYSNLKPWLGPPLPVISFSATPNPVVWGNQSTLKWSVQNATSCNASGAWSGNLATSGTYATGALTANQTYILQCTGNGGSTQKSLTVKNISVLPGIKLSASPSQVKYGENTTLTWSSSNADSCNATGAWSGVQATSGSYVTPALTQTETFTLTCTGHGGSKSHTIIVQDITPVPTLSFTANPKTIKAGGSSKLHWTSTHTSSCTASENWNGAQPLNGAYPTGVLNESTSYTLSCTGPGGSISKTLVVTVH